MNILFMGTPKIAAEMLQCCIDEAYNIIGVVTQCDKKVGRKQIITPCAVKEKALLNNIKVYQFESIKNEGYILLDLDYDLIVTCAYGQIIPVSILEHAKYDAINVHASLLPKYRGGAPIQRCIMNKETFSGISIMRMIAKMDAGAIFKQEKIILDKGESSKTLFKKCEILGIELLKEVLATFNRDHHMDSLKQDENKVTYAPIILKTDEKIDFTKDVMTIDALIRGLYDVPIAYMQMEDIKVKIIKAHASVGKHAYQVGEVIKISDEGLAVAALNGILYIEKLQIAGKSVCDAHTFYNGVGRKWIGKCFS